MFHSMYIAINMGNISYIFIQQYRGSIPTNFPGMYVEVIIIFNIDETETQFFHDRKQKDVLFKVLSSNMGIL